MNLLKVIDISKSYGASLVLTSVSFHLNFGQHIGLVGANGVGKTTLLKIIMHELEPDSGDVVISNKVSIGYLPQTWSLDRFERQTIEELILEAQGKIRTLENELRRLETQMEQEVEDIDTLLARYGNLMDEYERKGGYDIDHKIDYVLDGLNLSHLNRARKLSTLSGGEKSRVGIANMLLSSPDLLLLDEPTNHIDASALDWMETYLMEYKGGILVVSHDRHLLNNVANTIIEIDEFSRESRKYVGNYDEYLRRKAIERTNWELAYEHQQNEIKQLRQAIKGKARQVGFNRPARDPDKITHKFFGERVQKTVSRNVRAADQKLDRILENPIQKPPDPLTINPDFLPNILKSKIPLVVSQVSKAYGHRKVLESISFTLPMDSRLVITGCNGAGKSTLLKILAGLLAPDSGEVSYAPNIKVGFLDQEQHYLQENLSLFEMFRYDLKGGDSQLRGELLQYGFFKFEDTNKTVLELSTGQKRKLQIARLIVEKPNLLLLDEPTNHVSFDVLEKFEQALSAFSGPIIAVSHDRRFIQKFASDVWLISQGKLHKT